MSKSKRFYLIACFFGIAAIEVFNALIFFSVKRTENYQSWINGQRERARINLSWFDRGYEYHPYLGYQRLKENEPNPNKFNIALIGGSVAEQFKVYLDSEAGKKKIFTLIGTVPKNIEIHNLAAGGYKQPQQLISSVLNIETYDLFISLEGYNELFSPLQNCVPVEWPVYVQRFSPELGSYYLEVGKLLKEFFLFITNDMENFTYTSKVASYLLGKSSLIAIKKLEKLHFQKKPECPIHDKKEMMDSWYQFLLKQHLIHQHAGKKLITFIQPVPFLENSKPYSDFEKELLGFDSKTFSNIQSVTYKNAINVLKKDSRINLVDLTGIFGKIEKSVYTDSCCHLNPYGYELLTEEIFKTLAPLLPTGIHR